MARLIQTCLAAAAVFAVIVPSAVPDDVFSDQLTVVYASSRFEDRFDVYDPVVVERGLVLVNLKVRNLTRQDRTVEYRVDWRRADGLELSGISGWQTLRMSPNQEVTLRAAAQSRDAVSARITMREN